MYNKKSKWEKEIRIQINSNPEKAKATFNRLHELISNPIKLSSIVEDIYFAINNNTNDEFSLPDFQKFYNSTAEGLRTSLLDPSLIQNEFNKIDKMKIGKISKEDFKIYLSKLYLSFLDIINSELSSNIAKRNSPNKNLALKENSFSENVGESQLVRIQPSSPSKYIQGIRNF